MPGRVLMAAERVSWWGGGVLALPCVWIVDYYVIDSAELNINASVFSFFFYVMVTAGQVHLLLKYLE